MGQEIDLLKNYPKTNRNVKNRGVTKSEEDRAIAREFGKEFFDGSRDHGYGGFSYFPRFWQPVIPTFKDRFNLTESSSVLDVGCAKGFMLYDLVQILPGIEVKGVDISQYAIDHVIDGMKDRVQVADAKALPFEDESFDVVFSINTVHNLEEKECAKALQEIERISIQNSYITVDAYRNDVEKERMEAWNLTAKTIMSVKNWTTFFKDIGYTGDYYWFIP